MAISDPYSNNRGLSQSGEQQYGANVAYLQQGPAWNRGTPDSARARVGGGGQQQQQYNPFAGFPLSIYTLSRAQPAAGSGSVYARPGHGGGRMSPWHSGRGLEGYAGYMPTMPNGGGGGGVPATSPNVPPATTNPQTPVNDVGAQLQALLASYTNPITNGQLSNDTIQQAMTTLNAAGNPAWATQQYGGAFGQNLAQDVGRAGINLQRGAAEQQAAMDLSHQKARAGAGLDMAGLLQQLNSQNVMHGVNMNSGMLGAIMNLFGNIL